MFVTNSISFIRQISNLSHVIYTGAVFYADWLEKREKNKKKKKRKKKERKKERDHES